MRMTWTSLALAAIISASSFADTPWYEEGFRRQAQPGARAMALAGTTAFPVANNTYTCSAVRQAQFKHVVLFRSQERQRCYQPQDCGIGTLGGFCAAAAHKTRLEGYKAYVQSPAYRHLQRIYQANRCRGPVGLCMPVNRVTCDIPRGKNWGYCKGTYAQNPVNPPIFMRSPRAERRANYR